MQLISNKKNNFPHYFIISVYNSIARMFNNPVKCVRKLYRSMQILNAAYDLRANGNKFLNIWLFQSFPIRIDDIYIRVVKICIFNDKR